MATWPHGLAQVRGHTPLAPAASWNPSACVKSPEFPGHSSSSQPRCISSHHLTGVPAKHQSAVHHIQGSAINHFQCEASELQYSTVPYFAATGRRLRAASSLRLLGERATSGVPSNQAPPRDPRSAAFCPTQSAPPDRKSVV